MMCGCEFRSGNPRRVQRRDSSPKTTCKHAGSLRLRSIVSEGKSKKEQCPPGNCPRCGEAGHWASDCTSRSEEQKHQPRVLQLQIRDTCYSSAPQKHHFTAIKALPMVQEVETTLTYVSRAVLMGYLVKYC